MEKNKHLTNEDRNFIEDSLNHKMTYASIAKALGKDPTTISKEVKAHTIIWRKGALGGRCYNNCAHQFSCKKTALCVPCGSPKKYNFCRNCMNCNKHCPDYEPIICSRRRKTAHVCNGCGFMPGCNFEKKLYRASTAQEEYKTLLSDARSGIGLSEEELKKLDEKVSPLIRQGQSPHHSIIRMGSLCLHRSEASNLFLQHRSIPSGFIMIL